MSLVKISSGRREAEEPRLRDPRVLPCLYRLGGAAGDLRNCSGLTSVGGTGVLSVTWGHVLAVVRWSSKSLTSGLRFASLGDNNQDQVCKGPAIRLCCSKTRDFLVPAPGLGVASHQRGVAHRVERGVTRSHPDHGVRAPLAHRPADLPHVQSPRVADAAPDGVGALRHGVPVKHQLVVVLDEDVQRAVVVVPRVLDLDVHAGRWHVQQQIESGRLGVTQGLELQLQGAECWIPHINGFNATWDFLPHALGGYSNSLFHLLLLLPPPPPPPQRLYGREKSTSEPLVHCSCNPSSSFVASSRHELQTAVVTAGVVQSRPGEIRRDESREDQQDHY
ncbi:hypothetical protein EYF80_006902 [Liparis tanakae]|uniref:Uncharacterized protein n=1 Tax=Liparis tanakae TaxID=230148 RepID=A0A4Z2IY90_9TELE|nr:hypothetical protein EYF80_006902 [Liparis tanakae]